MSEFYSKKQIVEDIEKVIARLTEQFPHMAFVGKNFTIQNVKNELKTIIEKINL